MNCLRCGDFQVNITREKNYDLVFECLTCNFGWYLTSGGINVSNYRPYVMGYSNDTSIFESWRGVPEGCLLAVSWEGV